MGFANTEKEYNAAYEHRLVRLLTRHRLLDKLLFALYCCHSRHIRFCKRYSNSLNILLGSVPNPLNSFVCSLINYLMGPHMGQLFSIIVCTINIIIIYLYAILYQKDDRKSIYHLCYLKIE